MLSFVFSVLQRAVRWLLVTGRSPSRLELCQRTARSASRSAPNAAVGVRAAAARRDLAAPRGAVLSQLLLVRVTPWHGSRAGNSFHKCCSHLEQSGGSLQVPDLSTNACAASESETWRARGVTACSVLPQAEGYCSCSVWPLDPCNALLLTTSLRAAWVSSEFSYGQQMSLIQRNDTFQLL